MAFRIYGNQVYHGLGQDFLSKKDLRNYDIESSVLKLHTAWRRLSGLQERLWLERGSSPPYLRDMLNVLQTLSGATMRVSLGELSGGKKVRLQIVEEAADQLEPPPIS